MRPYRLHVVAVVLLAAASGCTGCLRTVSDCTPITCESSHHDCGLIDDGCGGAANCGHCAAGLVCGAGGPNVCGAGSCTPKTCATAAAECGIVSDGCSALLDCGNCSAGTCVVDAGPNHCQTITCTPLTCGQLDAGCGTPSDGCGGTLHCGDCTAPATCVSSPGPNHCEGPACVPKTCMELGLMCGPGDDGCGHTLSCGGCVAPDTCGGGGVSGVCGSTPISGNAWRTLGGDVQHSGYNAAETGVPPLSLAWTVGLDAGQLWPVVVEDGRVFAVTDSYFAGAGITAFDAADGGELWSASFGMPFSAGMPAVFNGHVLATHCNHASDTRLWDFEATTGTVRFTAPMTAQWETYWTPVAVNNAVYTNAGYYGGLYGIDLNSGAQIFFDSALEQYDEWSPALSPNGELYTFIAGNLRTHDRADGGEVAKVQVPWNWAGWSMKTYPVVGGGQVFAIAPPVLYAIDPAVGVTWNSTGLSFNGAPAYANGVVYALSGGNLRAHDAVSGGYLWSFTGDNALSYPPVLAAGYAYVSSANNVYAVDLSTHQQVWTDAFGGWLSIAGGKLFVASGTELRAYALTP